MAVTWAPAELSPQIRKLVSLKSINIMMGERGAVPETLSIIPFPSINLKGLSKYFEISDEAQRGGAKGNSLTLIFSEAADSIFYKYMNDFEALFDESINQITTMMAAKAQKSKFVEEILILSGKTDALLKDLRDAEISEKKAFEIPEDKPEDDAIKGFNFKIIVCGDPMVGKTSTVLRFTDSAFKRTYLPTIGVQISEKKIELEKARISYVIWDIAGQAKFEIMRKHFYQGADGQLLVFDLTRHKTLESIANWYQDIKRHLNKGVQGYILGNKSDLEDQREVNKEEISKLAGELGLGYIEASALTGENVHEAFLKMAERLIEEC